MKTHIVDPEIWPEDIYGLDESGFPPFGQGQQKVIAWASTKVQHKSRRASKENVTVLVTICANRTMVMPWVVYKGKWINHKWLKVNPAKAR